MDKWGRPDINTGLGLVRGMMDLKTFQNRQQDRAFGLKDREAFKGSSGMSRAAYEGKVAKGALKTQERKQQNQANIEKYIPMVQQGIEPNRKAEDFSYVDWLGAQTKVQQTLNADVNYQNDVLIKEENERTANEAKGNNMIATSEIYAGQGDDIRAAEILAPMYNFFPDNQEFMGVNPDNRKQWIMKDQRTDEEYMMDAVPYGQIIPMAKKFTKAYRTVDEGFQKKRRLHNNAEITKWDVWTASNGREALHFTFLDKNGAMREIWKDPDTGEVLKGYDVRTKQNVKSNLDFRPSEYWADKTKAEKSKVGLEKAKVDLKRAEEGGPTPKEQRASKAKIDAVNKKQIRALRKELRKAKGESARLYGDYKGDDPSYIQAKDNIKSLEDEIKELSGGKKPQKDKVETAMPPAEQHRGKIIKDTETGKRYKSDGTQWIEID
jgi:hypothetical protein